MTLASALGAVTLLTELALLGVLASRRVYRTLPLFMAYFAYSVILMAAGLATSPGTPLYLFVWILGVTIDTLFYLGVLAELGQSVLRFNRASPMPWGLVVLLFIGASVPISLLAQWPEIGHYDGFATRISGHAGHWSIRDRRAADLVALERLQEIALAGARASFNVGHGKLGTGTADGSGVA